MNVASPAFVRQQRFELLLGLARPAELCQQSCRDELAHRIVRSGVLREQAGQRAAPAMNAHHLAEVISMRRNESQSLPADRQDADIFRAERTLLLTYGLY